MLEPGLAYFEHVGCANSLADFAQTIRWLAASGQRAVDEPDAARLRVIHTCSFERSQSRRSEARARALLDGLPDDGLLVVTGCLSSIEPAAAARLAADPRVVVASPTGMGALARRLGTAASPDDFDPVAMEGDRVRVRVSRGCKNSCSFCAIPFSMGQVKSLPVERVAAAIAPHYADGRREFVLSGEDTGAWGRDLGLGLPDLLAGLARQFPGARLTLTTLNPHWLRLYLPAVLSAIRDGLVVPHLYCPAQSGSDRMLARMKRGYRSADLEAVYSALFSLGPDVRLFQDVIVGHPGEAEADYRSSAALVQIFPPYRLRVFCWTPRERTAAAGMGDRVAPAVAGRRARAIAADFLADWFSRQGLTDPAARLRFVFAGKDLPVNSNIPLFGPAGGGTGAATDESEDSGASRQPGRVFRLAVLPSTAAPAAVPSEGGPLPARAAHD